MQTLTLDECELVSGAQQEWVFEGDPITTLNQMEIQDAILTAAAQGMLTGAFVGSFTGAGSFAGAITGTIGGLISVTVFGSWGSTGTPVVTVYEGEGPDQGDC